MTITRRALLISNAGEVGEENYCKGVAVDIANYMQFLQAPQGGTWRVDEIQRLDRPTEKQVELAVSNLVLYDYSLIAFAGHGWYSSTDNATVLTLRRGERISSLKLRVNATRRTIILDCCREIRVESAMSESVEKQASLFAMATQRRRPDPLRCRAAYDLSIQAASTGLVVLHSSTPPEPAGDDERLGGYYTANLIGCANAWAAGIAARTGSITTEVLSVVAAHELATVQTEARSGRTQHPTIEKPRTSAPYFPFAVFA